MLRLRKEAVAGTLRVGLLVGLFIGLAQAHPAAAQDPPADDLELARALFESGIEAAEDQRWNEARVDFERSFELAPRSSTLFNLANAQLELGDLVGAATSYRMFLAAEHTGRTARYRPDAEQALEQIEPRIAEVTVALTHQIDGDVLELDGQPALTDVPIPMNPGSHQLLVRRGNAVAGELELVLIEGERRGVTLPVRPPTPVLVHAPGTDEESDDAVWLWLGVGAGAAVLAAVLVGVGVAAASSESAFEGNFGPGTVSFE